MREKGNATLCLKGHDKKLTVRERREIVLEALRGENHIELAQRYNINPSTVTYYLKKAREDPKEQLEEAMEEVLFRVLVVAALERSAR